MLLQYIGDGRMAHLVSEVLQHLHNTSVSRAPVLSDQAYDKFLDCVGAPSARRERPLFRAIEFPRYQATVPGKNRLRPDE
ncbi:MAG: hypothetical protein ACKVPX_14450 [Myxococcaceae bacterium]